MNMETNDTFSNLLNVLYEYGDKAVPVFFVISGLVFANVYLTKEKKCLTFLLGKISKPDSGGLKLELFFKSSKSLYTLPHVCTKVEQSFDEASKTHAG